MTALDIRRSAPARHDSRSSAHPLNTPYRKSRMPSLFNTIRGSIYFAVFVFTIICLAMAGHFESVLADSDLTRFVPFALFVCSASLVIIVVLYGFSFFLRERNPISTRIELGCLAFAGVFWLVLGLWLATSDSGDADVECFTSGSSQPLDDSSASFHTEQYQAMYRVLNAFAILNAVVFLIATFGLLFLAIRKHRRGDDHMWYGPVTSCAWFNEYNRRTKRSKSSLSGILPVSESTQRFNEKPEDKPAASRHRSARSSRSRNRQATPGTHYPARIYERQMREKYNGQSNLNRSGSSSTGHTALMYGGSEESFDNGMLRNPNRVKNYI
ncbi:hypothetical protein K435DRAFT_740713 [Dendrothele bispora CBS 962.96]|uniref:MARVEL domain-containing protein n=1 Tax=Dendrothele bispora (strain CBS 962.96) TaxID=1314807 RepID=A0A4S8MYL1_DENBC|nr:hypothetical protein K435DRAFT_740713 [Dendrothele bispora CBS 962.96]